MIISDVIVVPLQHKQHSSGAQIFVQSRLSLSFLKLFK